MTITPLYWQKKGNYYAELTLDEYYAELRMNAIVLRDKMSSYFTRSHVSEFATSHRYCNNKAITEEQKDFIDILSETRIFYNMATDNWKEKLLRSFKKLVTTDIYRALDECYSAEIVSDNEKEKVEKCQTRDDSNRQFLMILLRKSEEAYKTFLECLKTDSTDHSDAMSIIMETDVSQPLIYEEHPEAMQLRRKIYRNLQTVVENTDLKDIVNDFISRRIFGIDDLEKVTNITLTTNERNRNFLNLLLKKKGSHGYHLLISELRQHHTKLVETIERTDITEEEIDKEIEAHLRIVDLEGRGAILTLEDLKRIQRNLHPEGLDIIQRNLLPEEISPGKLKSWTQEGKTFFPTKATELIYDEVKSKRNCISSGLPGAGKTANIHYIALRLKNEGHRLCCVQTFKELISKMDNFGENEKQVYVIDDVFGVHGVDETKRKEWCDDNKDDLERCLNNTNVNILCSSRKQVIDDHKLSNIKLRFTIVNISEGKAVLSGDDRSGIFEKHAITKQRSNLLTENKDQLKPEIKEKIREIECPVGCFPLVCHLYTGEEKPKQTIEEYFHKPLNVIADHLKKLEVEDRLSHFCLLLCLIYDDKLPVNIITVGDESEETKKQRMKFLELCKLPVATSREDIREKMDTLLQTFIKRDGDKYHFVHDIIHDAVIKHASGLASCVHQVIMSHCSSKFMLYRVHLSGVVCEGVFGTPGHDAESCINIRPDSFICWGARVLDIVRDGVRTSDQLYNDIHEGRCSIYDDDRVRVYNPWWDVFHYNPCVQSTEGQTAIVQALDRKSPSEVQTIMGTDGYSITRDKYRHTALHWCIDMGLGHIARQTISMISTTRLRELDSYHRYWRGLSGWTRAFFGTDVTQIVRQKLQEGYEDSDVKQTVRQKLQEVQEDSDVKQTARQKLQEGPEDSDVKQTARQKLQEGPEDSDVKQTARQKLQEGPEDSDVKQTARQKLQEGPEDSDVKQTVRQKAKKGRNVTKSKCIMM